MQLFSNLSRLTKSASAPSLRSIKSHASSDDLISGVSGLSGLSEESYDALSHTISDSSLHELASHCSNGNSDEECLIRYGVDFVGDSYKCWVENNGIKKEIHTFKFARILTRFGCKYAFAVISHRFWEFIHSMMNEVSVHTIDLIHCHHDKLF